MHNPISFDIDKSSINHLISEFSRGNLVAYLGAGISLGAGLPNWQKLIEDCVRIVSSSTTDKSSLNNIKSFFMENNLTLCADLLQRLNSKKISQHIISVFGDPNIQPTQVHKQLTRLPFSSIFTTNYDCLLENCLGHNYTPLTWRDGDTLKEKVRDNEFFIAKIHGTIESIDSIVLSHSDFNQLEQERSFRSAFEQILAYQSVLFLGSSLRDQDLLSTIEKAKINHGRIGPHYTITFTEDYDPLYEDYIWENLNISTIVLNSNPNTVNSKSELVSSFLKYLSGKISRHSFSNKRTIDLSSSSFYLKGASDLILESAIKYTGAHRGSIYYNYNYDLKNQGLELASSQINKGYHRTATETPRTHSSKSEIDSCLSTYFQFCYNNSEPLYIPDLHKEPDFIQHNNITLPRFKSSDQEVKSIIATPIYESGNLVGLLVVESHFSDAFTFDHSDAIRTACTIAGAAYSEYRYREFSAKGIRPFLAQMSQFTALMNTSRGLAALDLKYLLYEIDSKNGQLIGHFQQGEKNLMKFSYKFTDISLATNTLFSRDTIYVENTENELKRKDPNVSKQGVRKFNIKGPVLSTPIRVDGRIASILVAWPNQDPSTSLQRTFSKLHRRIIRYADLIANDPDRDTHLQIEKKKSYFFLKKIDELLSNTEVKFSGSNVFDYDDKIIKEYINAIASPLIEESCQLLRLRLWLYDIKNNLLRCIYSRHAPQINKSNIANFEGINISPDNAWSKYTIQRIFSDPSARHYHKSLFKYKDPHSTLLHKDPDGLWIVAPIISHSRSNPKFLGYLEADNHIQTDNGPKEIRPPVKQEIFQRLALDIVAEALTDSMRLLHRLDAQI